MKTLPQTITVTEASKRYKVSVDTIRDRIRKKVIKGFRPGRNILVDVASADKWFMESTKLV